MSSGKKLIQSIRGALPGKYILFESLPDVADNSKAVFDELIRRGYNKKYIFVWYCRGTRRKYPKIKNVFYLYPHESRWDKALWKFAVFDVKATICCNRFLTPTKPNAGAFFLGHGTMIKDISGYYNPSKSFSLLLATSEEAADVLASQYKTEKAHFITLGYPRNDVLSEEAKDLHFCFPDRVFEKIIVWYPTFRQQRGGITTGAVHALPVVWDEARALELNACAKEHGVLLVLKPHFIQDVSAIKTLNLSNIVFIDDDFFTKNELSSYHFVGSCDALLTDYSSIYYDYTLCDKPIGLIWEDYEEYAQNPGFAVDMDDVMKGGEKIYTLDELKGFVCSVAAGEDHLRNERREIRDRFNISTDGKNTERVVNYIVDVFGL